VTTVREEQVVAAPAAGRSAGRFDVAVVGLGPVGTLLAGLLGLRGLRVIALDSAADVFPLPRAAHIDHTGLRAVQELGCLDELLPLMMPNPGIDFIGCDGDLLMRVPADRPDGSALPSSVYFYQPEFDGALRRRVTSLPDVQVSLMTEVVGLEELDDRVSLTCRRDGGELSEVHASYVVGCDGAASDIRQLIGVGLQDLGFHEKWYVVDLLLSRDVHLPQRAMYFCDPARPHVVIPMPGHRHRVEFKLLPGELEEFLGHGDIERILKELVDDQDLEIERAAVYTFHGLVADQWRVGRTLLAGDAAHQMPPFLGQGMCSGFRDATNLAWKIDHVLRRGAPQSLLDTYESERGPHVRDVIARAIDYGNVVALLDPEAAKKRDERLRREHSQLPFTLPTLTPGPAVLVGGGRMLSQPVLNGHLFDDVVGQRFLVLVRDSGDLGTTAEWWRSGMGARVLVGEELQVAAPSLLDWLHEEALRVAVVRPDRYLLAALDADLDGVTAAVRGFLAQA